jgi:uncharacterized protein YuzE
MKVSYDPSVDAAYINLTEPGDSVLFGFAYTCDPREVGGQIHLNFDVIGRLIGIEVLQASKTLPKSLLGGQPPAGK